MKKKEVDKAFSMGMLLGFDLGAFGGRVAPMVAGKKDPKEIEKILERELNDIFQKLEKEVKRGIV